MKTMMNRVFMTMLSLVIAVGLAGCGDDDNPTSGGGGGGDIDGTWVCYAALHDGVPEPEGGTYGVGGNEFTINADGSGYYMLPEEIGTYYSFTWTRDGQTLTFVEGDEPISTVAFTIADDTLTMVEDGITTIWQRHSGAGVLVGDWSIVSVVDDFMERDLGVSPGDFHYVFDADGTMKYPTDGEGEFSEYHVDGVVLTIDPFIGLDQIGVFTVVGSNLYFFVFIADGGPSGDAMYILKFVKD